MKGGNILQNISTKMKIVIAVVVVLIATTVGIYMYKQTQENTVSYYGNEEQSEETHISQITVHITGAINNPGVIILEEGARIVDALEAAGGETEEADVNRLNLAYVLEDGEKLYIPSKNEEEQEYITQGKDNMSEGQSKININSAQIEELITLPGVGEATANKIIEYRKENGKFQKIEDLKNVPGIGDSKYENIKTMIRV